MIILCKLADKKMYKKNTSNINNKAKYTIAIYSNKNNTCKNINVKIEYLIGNNIILKEPTGGPCSS